MFYLRSECDLRVRGSDAPPSDCPPLDPNSMGFHSITELLKASGWKMDLCALVCVSRRCDSVTDASCLLCSENPSVLLKGNDNCKELRGHEDVMKIFITHRAPTSDTTSYVHTHRPPAGDTWSFTDDPTDEGGSMGSFTCSEEHLLNKSRLHHFISALRGAFIGFCGLT